MHYRPLGKTNLRVSEVGLGCEHLQGLDYAQIKPVIDAALNAGINILDVFMPEPNVRSNIGLALAGRRKKVIIQGHIGAAWINGQYARTRELAPTKAAFEDLLRRLQTDYIDIGLFHFVDDESDFDCVFNGDIVKYAQGLKAAGTIKAIGMSSHNPQVALKAVDRGLIDMLLFSLNPAFDILPADAGLDTLFNLRESLNNDRLKDLKGLHPDRRALYEACETRGIGITVMKSLGAGFLLRAETSPFGVGLTTQQCLHYALTRPGVASVMLGARRADEIWASSGYSEASDKERDYSSVLANTPRYSLTGQCMYCNHCLPCPAEIDIAQVNKYLDLAAAGAPTGTVPDTLKQHYLALAHAASECLECGSCQSVCPFKVPVIARMTQAVVVFGK